jgi:uncharacterized protein
LEEQRLKFIADENVGKLARWLRLLGFNTLFFKGEKDSRLLEIALTENRILVTRDTRIMERRMIAGGQVKALLLKTDDIYEQLLIVLIKLDLKPSMHLFSICLECNLSLISLSREEAKERVPAYVWQTQQEYVECPECRRVYWKGTHWAAMKNKMVQMNIIVTERKDEKTC